MQADKQQDLAAMIALESAIKFSGGGVGARRFVLQACMRTRFTYQVERNSNTLSRTLCWVPQKAESTKAMIVIQPSALVQAKVANNYYIVIVSN